VHEQQGQKVQGTIFEPFICFNYQIQEN